MTDLTQRRFPKVLADEVLAALRAVDELDHETCFELLRRYRRNRTSIVVTFGIDVAAGIAAKLKAPREAIPDEWYDHIRQLDKAFRKLHSYNAGGQADYVAKDVYKIAQGLNGRRPKPRLSKIESNKANFEDELKKRGFFNQPLHKEQRGAIVKALARLYGASPSTINRHISRNFSTHESDGARSPS